MKKWKLALILGIALGMVTIVLLVQGYGMNAVIIQNMRALCNLEVSFLFQPYSVPATYQEPISRAHVIFFDEDQGILS